MDENVVRVCATLIRFDTSNYGNGESHGERGAAEWVAAELDSCGFLAQVFESVKGRASVVTRLAGRYPSAPALLIHGHLDVVPAGPGWTVDPLCGEVREGCVWEWGACDMKKADAMMLSVARELSRRRMHPVRDVIMAFVADEEDAGFYGAKYLVDAQRDLFQGVTTAIGESGADLTRLPAVGRLYAIATAERGTARIALTSHGEPGHESRPSGKNAVTVLAAVLTAISTHEWPVEVLPPTAALHLRGLAEAGIAVDPWNPDSLSQAGDVRHLIKAVLRNGLTHRCSPRVATRMSFCHEQSPVSTVAFCRDAQTTSAPRWMRFCLPR